MPSFNLHPSKFIFWSMNITTQKSIMSPDGKISKNFKVKFDPFPTPKIIHHLEFFFSFIWAIIYTAIARYENKLFFKIAFYDFDVFRKFEKNPKKFFWNLATFLLQRTFLVKNYFIILLEHTYQVIGSRAVSSRVGVLPVIL